MDVRPRNHRRHAAACDGLMGRRVEIPIDGNATRSRAMILVAMFGLTVFRARLSARRETL